jgi:hypothetical protein
LHNNLLYTDFTGAASVGVRYKKRLKNLARDRLLDQAPDQLWST